MIKKNKEDSKINKYNTFVAIIILIASVVLFYFDIFTQVTLYKVLILLAGVVLAFFVFLKSPQGDKFIHFFKETRIELKKVVWPNREDTLKTTGIIMVVVIIVAIFLWIVDAFFTWLVDLISYLDMF